jgi:hypothetical protein
VGLQMGRAGWGNMQTIKLCQYCFEPLPVNSWPRRFYHEDCSRIVLKDRKANAMRAFRQRLKHPRRKRNPMLYLGRDYVSMKLTG